MVSRLKRPCRGDKSDAGFEHGAVIRETVDDAVYEFLRQLHPLAIVRHSESGEEKEKVLTGAGWACADHQTQ